MWKGRQRPVAQWLKPGTAHNREGRWQGVRGGFGGNLTEPAVMTAGYIDVEISGMGG